MSAFWLGLEYAVGAFGLCLLALGARYLAFRLARLIIRQQINTSNECAVESDDRNFRVAPDGQ
jgi:hypothetical protein